MPTLRTLVVKERALDEGEKLHKAELKKSGISAKMKKRHEKCLKNIEAKRKVLDSKRKELEEK